jgi:hypothetical protein
MVMLRSQEKLQMSTWRDPKGKGFSATDSITGMQLRTIEPIHLSSNNLSVRRDIDGIE